MKAQKKKKKYLPKKKKDSRENSILFFPGKLVDSLGSFRV
jgi:hypothetical protein